MKSAAVVALVMAVGAAAAAPALRLVPALDPVPAATWGQWSRLALEPGDARAQGLEALRGAARAGALALIVVAALSMACVAVARAADRRADLVVRRIVGASRRRLTAAAFLEGGATALAGGAAAVVGALTVGAVWRNAWPGALHGSAVPTLLLAGLGAVALVGALLPLWFARPRRPGAVVVDARVPLVVPAAQLAVAFLALTASVRLGRLTPAPSAAPSDATGVVVAIALPDSGAALALDRVLSRVRRDSTVRLASVSSPGTLIGLGPVDVMTTECGRCAQGGLPSPLRVLQATHHLASADTFRALDLRTLAGRVFTDADRHGAAPVAVVNQYLAERYFEGGRAVGKRVRVGGPDDWYRVVGVVEDARAVAIGAGVTPRARVYLSVWQHAPRQLDVLVRSANAYPELTALGSAVTETGLLARETAALRWFARVLAWEGWVALGISLIGLFVVVRLWIAAALPEMALRRAVGARRRHVLGRIGVRLLALVAGGGAIAWWLDPLAAAWLPRAPADLTGAPPALLGAVGLLLGGVTLLAAAAPAWRAARAAPALLAGAGAR